MAEMTTTTAGMSVPVEVRNDLIEAVKKQSALLQVAKTFTQTDDVEIQSMSGLAPASFVDELEEKPSGEITPKTSSLRLRFLVSPETIHSKNLLLPSNSEQLWEQIITQHSNSLALGLDSQVINGAGSADIADLSGIETQTFSAETAYADFTAARAAISRNNNRATASVVSPVADAIAMGALNRDGQPLFPNGFASGFGTVAVSEGVSARATDNTVGVVGDFSKMVIGLHPDKIVVEKSNEVAWVNGTPVSLRKRNAFSIFLEMAVSVGIDNKNAFVRLIESDPAA